MSQPISLFKTDEHGSITILTKIHQDGPLMALLMDNKIKFSTGRMCVIGTDNTIRTKYESLKIKEGRITDNVLVRLLKDNDFDIQDFSEFAKVPE